MESALYRPNRERYDTALLRIGFRIGLKVKPGPLSLLHYGRWLFIRGERLLRSAVWCGQAKDLLIPL